MYARDVVCAKSKSSIYINNNSINKPTYHGNEHHQAQIYACFLLKLLRRPILYEVQPLNTSFIKFFAWLSRDA